MKKVMRILIVLLILCGCAQKNEENVEDDEIIELISNHKIGVYFSSIEAIDYMVSDYEKNTGGKLISCRPEYGYYVFSFDHKTDKEIEELQKKSEELTYVKNVEIDTEFVEPEQPDSLEDESDDSSGAWILPGY